MLRHAPMICKFIPLFCAVAILNGPFRTAAAPSSGNVVGETLRFTRYSNAGGLSQNTVLCALQDRRGFMWFGTQDGLNRFDGHTFRVFKNNPDDSTSLSENWIWTIYEDRAGYLWIGTFGGGACRFDPSSETFTRYRHDANDPRSLSHDTVWSFCEDSAGVLWIGANNGLNRYTAKTGTFSHFQPPLKNSNVFNILPADSGALWLTTPEALLEFNPAGQEFAIKLSAAEIGSAFYRGRFAQAKSGALWLGTSEAGLVRFDPKTKNVTRYRRNPGNLQKHLPDDQVTAVYVDPDGAVWAGTRQGLALIYLDATPDGFVQTVQHDPLDGQSLSHGYVFSIYESRGGEIWIGTRSGLNRFDRRNQKFRHYRYSPNESNTLSHSNVLPMIALRREPGMLWIGTNNGLNRLNLKSGHYEHFFQNPAQPHGGPAGNYILSLLEDRRGNLWIGTRGGGLSKMTVNAKGLPRFIHYRHHPADSASLGSDNVHCIYEDRRGAIWIGTGGGGLNQLSEDGKTFKRYAMNLDSPGGLRDSFVYTIFEDPVKRDNFWIGTASAGLHLFNRESETFVQFTHEAGNAASLSNNRVLCIFQSAKNHGLWIGTAGGLNKLAMRGGKIHFQSFRERDGLPNDVIYGILEGDAGNLWISTNGGLSRIRVDGGSLHVKTYTADDGLQSNEFSQNSFHRAAGGVMYFGGINGFNAFHPDSLRDNPMPPPVMITDFKILNRPVAISSDGSTPLRRSIVAAENVVLSHRDAMFSFEFAALNFTLPQKNQHAYKMDGFDADWVKCGARRFAIYTNLDPGKYVFRVKASNNDGVWNEEGAFLRITITPPPWRTGWAYALYAVAFAGSVFGYIRFRIRAKEKELAAKLAIERARKEERDRVRKKSSADFHDEAGNVITKINLLTELARRHAPPPLADYLLKIEENTKTLSSRMRDFIWALDPEKDSLHDTLLRLKDFGASLFESGEVRFQTNDLATNLSIIHLPMEDRREIVLIFKEAMHNCLKHARCQTVTFAASIEDGELALTLADDGVGFATGQAHQGYGLKNMQMRAQKLGGKIAIVSNPGQGTAVRFTKRLAHE